MDSAKVDSQNIKGAAWFANAMTTMHKVQTKHLNEHSSLYGGQLLEWIDNYCLAKTERYKKGRDDRFVTRHMDCDFIGPAYLGDLITMEVEDEKVGNTSITFSYVVKSNETRIARGKAVFVKMNNGKAAEIVPDMAGSGCVSSQA